jgi:TetR/AcrR family transcriptional repressor of nem operon
MSKAEKTRAYIIEKAAPIFNIKGYSGTSLSDLVEATGLTKGSIYGNFENKDEIAIAAYHHNAKRLSKRLDEACMERNTAAETLIGITEYYRINWQAIFERGGCPNLNASIEADDNLPFLREHVQGNIKDLAQKFGKIIEEGIKKREFRKNVNPMEYAYTILALIEGGIMLAKIEDKPKHLFTAMDRIVKIIKEELMK